MRRGHTRGSGVSMGLEGPLTGILKPKRLVPKQFRAKQARLKNDRVFAALYSAKASARARSKTHPPTLPTKPFDWRD